MNVHLRCLQRWTILQWCYRIAPHPTPDFAAAFNNGVDEVPYPPIVGAAILSDNISRDARCQITNQNGAGAGLRPDTYTIGSQV